MAIKVYYAKLNNMGDLLNEYILHHVTLKEITHCPNYVKFDVMGIGSCGGAIWANREDDLKVKTKDLLKMATLPFVNSPCAVWGTGFFRDYSGRNLKLVRKNVSFIAVRGALSQQIIENSLDEKISPVLCDGGILSSEIIQTPEKKYKIGFIPHYKEHDIYKKKGIWYEFANNKKHCINIDLKADPIEVIRQIGECEFIISSSLHGCVVADSFHIPNIRVCLSEIPGSGFKFDDYYSGYGLTVPALNIEKVEDIPTVNEIIDSYQLSFKVIDEKKKNMAYCLKRFISENDLL